jgi:hypothetical protein
LRGSDARFPELPILSCLICPFSLQREHEADRFSIG